MSTPQEVGVVVVGLGIAGKVRVRDLMDGCCAFRLRGVVSRRPVELEAVESLNLEEALKRTDVQALLVCTEPALHEEYVRKGLENGKHILVEYPLALSSKVARELYELAEEKGLVLHEENIALLSENYDTIKTKASQVDLESADYALIGSYNGWIEKFDETGLPYITGVSGLQMMLSLFADLNVVGGKIDRDDDGFSAYAQLTTLRGKLINMKQARSKSRAVRREKKAVYIFEDGDVIDIEKLPNMPRQTGLFKRDMINFYKAILDGKIPENKKQLTIRSLELAEEIHSFFDMS